MKKKENRGGPREGAGPPRQMEDGRRINVYLDAESLEIAEAIENGNISAGIRLALKTKRFNMKNLVAIWVEERTNPVTGEFEPAHAAAYSFTEGGYPGSGTYIGDLDWSQEECEAR